DLDEVPLAEQLAKPAGDLAGVAKILDIGAPLDERMTQLARHAPRQADDSLVIGLQQLLVDSRLVVEAFERGGRGELDEVLKAGAVLGQEREVVTRLLTVGGVF